MNHEVDVEEGLLPGQQRLRGLLRALEGRAVLRQELERVERRRLHGRGRPLHPLVQRAADQGIARGDELAAVQAVAQSSGISALVGKTSAFPNLKIKVAKHNQPELDSAYKSHQRTRQQETKQAP